MSIYIITSSLEYSNLFFANLFFLIIINTTSIRQASFLMQSKIHLHGFFCRLSSFAQLKKFHGAEIEDFGNYITRKCLQGGIQVADIAVVKPASGLYFVFSV